MTRDNSLTEQELDELVKRLVGKSHRPDGPQNWEVVLDNPDGPEAAAAIQALREQVKGLEKERDEILDTLFRIAFSFSTSAHIAHDMRVGRFPQRSSEAWALAEMVKAFVERGVVSVQPPPTHSPYDDIYAGEISEGK